MRPLVAEANKVGRLDYEADAPVYELVSHDGETFVMQSSTMPAEEVAELGDRLQPPEGGRAGRAPSTSR